MGRLNDIFFIMKKIKGRLLYILFVWLVLLYLPSGCEKDPEPEPEPQNLTPLLAWQIMNDYYLWNETMPVIDPSNYNTPQDVMEALRNRTYDRFSYIEDTEAFNQYFQEGKYIGYGLSLKYAEDGILRVAFVYHNSPADHAGINRGWALQSINGTNIEPFSDYTDLLGEDQAGIVNSFIFTDLDQQEVSLSMTKQEVNINSVLHSQIIEIGDTTVAYLVFNHFIQTSLVELDSIFTEYSSTGVDELILDLRYNRGGMESVYSYLAGLIGGTITENQVITKYVHNNKQAISDREIRAESFFNSISVDRVLFITSRSTASASELIINGLKPLIEVRCFGDNTYGKPVGMYIWQYDDLTFVPICFRFLNANDEGDFYDGLVPDVYVTDDLALPFGNPGEDCFQSAMNYLETGILEAPGIRKAARVPVQEFLPAGIRSEIGAI